VEEKMDLKTVINYLDELLKTNEISDESLNGLVLENNGMVSKVGLTVDFNTSVIEKGIEEKVDMMIFHHGPYWGSPVPITGSFYKKIKLLISNNIAVYVSHLPLDLHPQFGNNSSAMKLLGFENTEEFGNYHGINIGRKFSLKEPTRFEDLLTLLESKIGKPILYWKFGEDFIKEGAFVSGDAVFSLPEAIEKELDILIVGEPRHYSYSIAKDNNINLVFMGHYQSETLGVKSLGKHLSEKFGLDTTFLSESTGL